ncbi:hypothetical protein EDD37DRAFT_274344 [Exophiala viscosa]|uniref:Uncharacterized protein n=1 Tax=Exophiala viscosa TaxID=2486360 RepID=A0AAN6E6Z5_9EURO|nr:hypothetical protein EDD36DRAFT_36624 [Exophiala viscosa]KAI1627744.1 hypothetical protein EDD37DRAFT_274344 [Exophiala viscosa]
MEQYIQTPSAMSTESLNTVSVGEMSEESFYIASPRREDEYRMIAKKEEVPAGARLGHILLKMEDPIQAKDEKAYALGDWGQLLEDDSSSLSTSNEASSTPATNKQDNICDEKSNTQKMAETSDNCEKTSKFDKLQIDKTLDHVLYRFLLLSKEVSTKSSDEYLKSHAAKEAELMMDDLVKQGSDKAVIDALDQETTATIDCQAMQSRHVQRLDSLQRRLATEMEFAVEDAKDTMLGRGKLHLERGVGWSETRGLPGPLVAMLRAWQMMIVEKRHIGRINGKRFTA